jgi:hypothetical protein
MDARRGFYPQLRGHHEQASSYSRRRELVRSKQILQAWLSRSIKALAYPYSWLGTHIMTTKVLAPRAGYHLAFSSQERIIDQILTIGHNVG